MEFSPHRQLVSLSSSSHDFNGCRTGMSDPLECIGRKNQSSNARRNRHLALIPAAAPRSWLEPLEQRLLFTQTLDMPMITEFLAANNNGLVDNHGHTSDWIEIYTPQVSNFDLSSYSLTDDPNDLTKWQFPTGTVMTGGSYMIVFASGDNEAVLGQPFHTNFQLSSGGGYLGLVADDGLTVLSDYNYPEQVSDTSYGIATNSTSTQFVTDSGALV